MPLPRVAIVGRPNVGKSSLLNMIAGEKVSIVDPTPGVTRDRVSVTVDLPAPDRRPARSIEFTDTGGYGVYTAEGARYDDVGADLSTLTRDIEFQIAEAVRSADLVLFAVDAQAGITPQDLEIARLLREQRLGRLGTPTVREGPDSASTAPSRRVPIRVVATKVDGPKWEAHAHELAGLGFGDPLMVSPKNNYMRRDFIDALYEIIPEPGGAGVPARLPEAAARRPELMLAIVGKRNAGKSTLVNTLAGEARVIVSEIAGTTRDAVDVRFEMDGRSLVAIDTAGLRRRKSFADRVEWFAFDRAKRSVERADAVLFMIDAAVPISQVDQQLAMVVQKAFKPCILVVNKWDLVQGRPGRKGGPVTPEDYEEYLRKELRGLDFAPISFMSAADGLNVRETVGLAFDLREQAQRRVTTGQLNRLVRTLVERQPPPSKIGVHSKVLYVAQVAVDPPTIVLVVNRPELISPQYQRFLMNRFRETLPFPEVPIKLLVRGRRRDEETAARAEAAGAGPEKPETALDDEGAEFDLPTDAEAYFEED